ncbi:MAG: tetratricopeptide repeat protein [Acidobacteriota bacterium]|nr:tetratricopeptide repeat protein [Acidobacteriota bacterium]MDH3528170.1 tetratricopeptide repeat protein [Acidobacteriota bacterium]
MRHFLKALAVVVFSFNVFGSDCAEQAKVVAPSIGAEARADFEIKQAKAKADHQKDPKDADALIWFGRRTAYLGDYKKAIHIYTEGIRMHPRDARMYRHRGHRFISIRCFDDAIRDFERAAAIFEGEPDQVEPDGLPNALNIPTSTLQSNTWYHLGLAHYLKGDFDKALEAYRACIYVSENPDMFVATANWLYVTLRKMGKNKEAAAILEKVDDDLDVIENESYYDLLKLYKGSLKPDDFVVGKADALSNASVQYGLGNWELINGNRNLAMTYFKRVLDGDQWSSFGFIAAEAEMKRLGATAN